MRSTFTVIAVAAAAFLTSSPALAQINFEKTGYYLSLGDSIAAGEGALPVTHGFVYELYDRGVFGQKQVMDFANIGIKGATSDEVQALQVPQALCILPPRIGVAPSVITVTAGANDFFVYLASGIPQNPGVAIPQVADQIAAKVANIIRSLVFGIPNLPAHCARTGIPGIKVLVFNYYGFDHPDPQIDFLLDLAVSSFSDGLRTRLAQIQTEIQASGKTARVGLVDTSTAMEGKGGLLLIEKRNGFTGAFEFEIHPSNAGHGVIAREFEGAWQTLR
jgi:lysophospholipase L1-like esterase